MAGLQVAVGALYLLLGRGFVLDDWFTLANAHFDGALMAAGTEQWAARPGAGVVYWFVFGLIGPHPVVVQLLLTGIAAVTVVVLYVALARLVGRTAAVAICLIWTVLPNHTTLETWASASNIAVALLLLVTGVLVLTDPPSRTVDLVVAALFAASGLCYEATIPFAVVAGAAVPILAGWGFRWRTTLWAAIGSSVAALWVVVHWHPQKHLSRGFVDVSQVVPGHFGWGVFPIGPVADVMMVLVLVGTAWVVFRLVHSPEHRAAGSNEWLIVGGAAVIVLGTVPFVRYLYGPLGYGDRFAFLSSVGGAMVLAGVLLTLATRWRLLAGIGFVAVVALGAVAHVGRAEVWSKAGADAVAILDAVQARSPDPTEPVVLGPHPVMEQDIAAYLDPSNIESALALRRGVRGAKAVVVGSERQYRSTQGLHIDIVEISRLGGGG